MKICVLIKQVPDTWTVPIVDPITGWLDRSASESVVNDLDERALELALRVKDEERSVEVVVVSMGPESAAEALRKSLAMGADAAIHISDDGLRGSDAVFTARVLAAAIADLDADLVLAGAESSDGRGGVVPAMVADVLSIRSAGALADVSIAPDGVKGLLATSTGVSSVQIPLPAVVSVTEAAPEPRFPGFKGIMGAKRKPVTRISLTELGLEEPSVRSVMISAVAKSSQRGGQKIVDDGNAGSVIADYIALEQLI